MHDVRRGPIGVECFIFFVLFSVMPLVYDFSPSTFRLTARTDHTFVPHDDGSQ
jgi:hypothetical protein